MAALELYCVHFGQHVSGPDALSFCHREDIRVTCDFRS